MLRIRLGKLLVTHLDGETDLLPRSFSVLLTEVNGSHFTFQEHEIISTTNIKLKKKIKSRSSPKHETAFEITMTLNDGNRFNLLRPSNLKE